MDEIGFIATFIDDSGFIKVAPVGGVDWAAAAYGEVLFKNGARGIIVPEEKAKPNDFKADKFYIDIGASGKTDASVIIKIGDTCTLAPKIIKLAGDRIAASKLDDKIACAILIHTLMNMKNTAHACDLYFVFTAQEEVGLRGAKTAAQSIMPDYSLAVDVTDTGDTPECTPMATKLGGGAAIKLMDRSAICHREMVNLLMKTAKEFNITYQSEIMTAGGTDTAAMQSAGEGSVAGAISVPARYIHTGVEMCDMGDVRACADLLCGTLKKI
jgi:endoglucanase